MAAVTIFNDSGAPQNKVRTGKGQFSFQSQKKVMPKNWCFCTVVLEKILESPLDTRRSNQLILKEINPEYSLKRVMLKLQYFGHVMFKAQSLEKTLMLGEKLRKLISKKLWSLILANILWPNNHFKLGLLLTMLSLGFPSGEYIEREWKEF